MTDAIKLKVLPQFPARLIGRAGIDVTKTTGDYYLDLDFTDFPVIGVVPAGTAYALIFDPATGLYSQLPISLLGGGGGGAVASVFGRTGAVVAALNDYVFAQIGATPTTVAGYGITDAMTEAPNDGQLYGRKSAAWSAVPSGGGGGANYMINPDGTLAQAGVGAIGDGVYTGIDQWVSLVETGNQTSSQLANAEDGTPVMMRLTQSLATAQRRGVIQHLENPLCSELRGQDVAMSARVRMSVAGTLRFAIVEWTGSVDGYVKDVVLNWASTTYTVGNFFTPTSTIVTAVGSLALAANTLTNVSLTGHVSGSMNNIAVFFWTDSQQAQNVTLDIAKVKLEQGTAATAYQRRPPATELAMAQRYYQKVGFAFEGPVTSGNDAGFGGNYMCPMRAQPTLSAVDSSTTNLGAPVSLAANGASPLTSYEYRKRASGSGPGALISTITCDARI